MAANVAAAPPDNYFRTSIQAYLECLPMQTFHRLFLKPATSLAIFRLLPALAKQLVMSLLYVDVPLSLDDIANWCLPTARRKQSDTLEKLARLHVVNNESGKLVLNPTFREQLQNALTGGGDHASFGLLSNIPDPNPVNISHLDRYAMEKWEAILHFMVRSATTKRPSAGVIQLMKQSNLMAELHVGQLSITNKGFQFLLQDTNTQVWAFLLQYLDAAVERRMDIVEVLNFLFQLGSMELGSDYSIETLTDTQRQMLEDLRDYGLVFQRKPTSRRFYPTRLATTLTSGGSAKVPAPGKPSTGNTGLSTAADPMAEANEVGYILLETNYRVYAYTDSALQIAILNLFVTLNARFGNMVAGTITRESIRGALVKGITAEQVITYLSTHAHPQMRKKTPLLPLTVVDQIRLWEMERNRLKVYDGFLYHSFARSQDFETVQRFSQDVACNLYENAPRRMLVVTPDGHQQVRAFIMRKMADKKSQSGAATPASSSER